MLFAKIHIKLNDTERFKIIKGWERCSRQNKRKLRYPSKRQM